MDIRVPKWISRLLFPEFTPSKQFVDPTFGELFYFDSRSEWEGEAAIFPGEPTVKIILHVDYSSSPTDLSKKFLEWKSQWPSLRRTVLDTLYDFFTTHAPDPNSGSRNTRYELPDRNRFEQLSWMSYLRIFNSTPNSDPDDLHPDFEVGYWTPLCWRYEGCMSIEITNWVPGRITLAPEVKKMLQR